MYEQINGYQFRDQLKGTNLGRKKRLEAQARRFKKIVPTSSNNSRRRNEFGRTIIGQARILNSYIEYPLLTLKKSQKAVQLGLIAEALRPVGYSI